MRRRIAAVALALLALATVSGCKGEVTHHHSRPGDVQPCAPDNPFCS